MLSGFNADDEIKVEYMGGRKLAFTNLGHTGKPSISRTPKMTPKKSAATKPTPAKASGGVKKGSRAAPKTSEAESVPTKKTPRVAATAAAAMLAVAAEDAGPSVPPTKRTMRKTKKVRARAGCQERNFSQPTLILFSILTILPT